MKHYTLPDISQPGKIGCFLPELDVPRAKMPDKELLNQEVKLPEVSEVELIRYFTALSKLNYGVDSGFYPLGSCTMKYSPKLNEDVARLAGFNALHPYQSAETAQGALQLMYELQNFLAELTGMAACSVAPMAGAQGELAGILIVRAYHRSRNDAGRKRILVPDSAHGTNPATSAMVGFEISAVPSDENGNLDLDALQSMMTEEVAAMTLTMPTTLGLFDPQIEKISQIVHSKGALLIGDGANFNSLIGKVKFGELGMDCVQINLHKTFSTPHGGGGPGSGPVCVSAKLANFLPSPLAAKKDGKYDFMVPSQTVGNLGAAYGNFGVMLKAYAYIRTLGAKGLEAVSEGAVLNANYMKEKLKAYYYLPYDRTCMHEVVFSGKRQKAKGIATMDVAKRLLDYGFHPPTVYFPLIVEEAIMTEPTETESKATLDAFIETMVQIAKEVDENPDILHSAPHNTPVRRLDDVLAARKPNLRWEWGEKSEG